MWLLDLWEQNLIQKSKMDNMFNTETMLSISEIKNDTVIENSDYTLYCKNLNNAKFITY